MNIIKEAEALYEQGFLVFPVYGVTSGGQCTCGRPTCSPKQIGKHPCFSGWQEAALASTPHDFANWARAFPGCNLAIATEGLIVIDFDEPDSAMALELVPMLSPTLMARSGREGGVHWYYRASLTNTLTVHQLGGIDIRSTGGYIIAPPSRHRSGREYAWVNPGTDMAKLPAQPLAYLTEKSKIRRTVQVNIETGESDLVPNGQRHDFLRDEIFRRTVTQNMDPAEVQSVVQGVLLAKLEDPDSVPKEEIESLIRGAVSRRDVFNIGDMTELGLAAAFTEYWDGNLVQLATGEWFRHEGGLWIPVRDPAILFRPVRETVYNVKKGLSKGDDEKVSRLHRWFGSSGTYTYATAVVKFATETLRMDVDNFQVPLDTIPFRNGLIDMITGDFRPFQASDHVIGTVACDYDPAATCPKWIETIAHITGGDPAIIRLHQQVFGYLIGTRTMRGVFFFVGPKSSGKSTLVTALNEILGPFSGTAQLGLIHTTRSFSEDEDMARTCAALAGRRFVFMDETKKDAIVDPAKFKRIATRDAVLTGRHRRQDAFQFINRAKVVVITNNQPQIDPDDDAAWDRVMFVPFLVPIDPALKREGFKDELMAEAPGIMNWCLQGFQDYAVNGIIVPDGVRQQIADWQTEENPMAQFVEEVCLLAPDNRVVPTLLWERYEGWRIQQGYGEEAGRFKSVGMFVKSLRRTVGQDRVESAKIGGKRWIRGIQLKGDV